MLLGIGALLAVILFLQNAGLAEALQRTVGPSYDVLFRNVSILCNGTNQESFAFANCTALMDCVFNHLPPSFLQTMSIGGSISGLLPTILVLIGLLFLAHLFRDLLRGLAL